MAAQWVGSAIVTGAGTGIGAAVARRLAAEGFFVVGVGRRPEPLTSLCHELGGAVVVGDAAKPETADHVVDVCTRMTGSVDVVVANASAGGGGALGDVTDEAWAQSFDANVTTAFVTIRAALPSLRKSKGSVVIVSSIAGLAAPTNLAPYVMAKHALIGMTRSLAVDEGPRVRVNAVCPGWVRTPIGDEEMARLAALRDLASIDDAYALATQDTPLRRPAEPDEVANVIWFLASPQASAMTGAVITVDGGATAVDVPTLAFGR